ncbi:MAG TPA: D-aminoacyl-tRNA deacylase [Candidatus Binatia bacterium]
MRLLIQRVKEAGVAVDGATIGRAGAGLCLFLGVAREDTREDADYLARKAASLRIFADESGKLNRSVAETGGEILVVSEFTLYGAAAKGRRPSFSRAAPPGEARPLYDCFVQKLKDLGLRVATGKFQAEMEVTIVNDGPVTLILDSR